MIIKNDNKVKQKTMTMDTSIVNMCCQILSMVRHWNICVISCLSNSHPELLDHPVSVLIKILWRFWLLCHKYHSREEKSTISWKL